MEPQLQEPKNGDHRLIWQKIKAIEDYLTNDIAHHLDKLDTWMWKIVFLVLGSILTPLTLIVILRALKIF